MYHFIEMLEAVRSLCSTPSKVPGKGYVALEGLAPRGHVAVVGLTVEAIVRWVGAETPLEGDLLKAVEYITGTRRAAFAQLIWAAHALERAAFRHELVVLDADRPRKGLPAERMSPHAIRGAVIARRIGLLRTIERMGGKVDAEMTSAELLRALQLASERANSRRIAATKREAYPRFLVAKRGGFTGDLDAFLAREAKKARESRRTDRGLPAKPAVVATVEADEDGGTKVVETKVRDNPTVTRRRASRVAPPPAN